MNQTMNCPLCNQAGCSQQQWSSKIDVNTEYRYDCPRCGSFILSDVLKDGALRDLSSRQRAVLSHRLRRQQRDGRAQPSILQSDLPQADEPLPNPAEQADNLIFWIGVHQPSPEASAIIPEQALSAVIGTAITPNNSGLHWLLMQEEVTRLFAFGHDPDEGMYFSFKFDGWQRYEALKHAQGKSRTAFMAMKFDSEMDRVVKTYFKPAVALTGFELRVLTDGQPAGLIDDQLRVALHTSRFVIADLTDDNDGAYWEAGFAEGLGRPVIYTCRKKEWEERKTHFDTNHLHTIIWNPDDLGAAATRLTATIRATLPVEAKMTD